MKRHLQKAVSLAATFAVLLSSLFATDILAKAANDYHVALLNVNERTENDGKGDNWNDYIVDIDSSIETVEKSADFSNNEAFIVYASKKTANMIFRFDAGEGKVFKTPTVSWCGKAVSDAGNYVKVFVGYDLSREDWELIGEIGQDKTKFESSNNYSAPCVTALDPIVGSGYRCFYVKVEMYNYKKTNAMNTAFSNLTVDATTEDGETVTSVPENIYVEGIESDTLEMKSSETVSFTAKALPFSLSDRTCSVSVTNTDVADVIENDGVYTLTAKLKGETELVIKANVDNSEKRVKIKVSGETSFYGDTYSIYTTNESGNISGKASSFKSVNGSGYGPKGLAGDYIVIKNVDFTKFGTIGATSIKVVAAYDKSNVQSATIEVYIDELKKENLVSSLVLDPYGSINSDTQELYGGLSRALTGKHDAYIVLKNDDCRILDVAFGNYTPEYDTALTAAFDDNYDTAFLRHTVATRNIERLDGYKIYPTVAEKAGEIIFRIDAKAGEQLDTLLLESSIRNIHSGEIDYGTVEISVSCDRNDWYTLKKITDKLDNNQKPELLNVSLNLDAYAKTQKSIFVKVSIVRRAKAQKTWCMLSAMNLTPTSKNIPDATAVSDIALKTDVPITWYDNYGAFTIKEGTEVTLSATALPLNATDTSLTVNSSDSETLAVQTLGNGKWLLAAFNSGSAMITVTSKSGVVKYLSVNVEQAPKVHDILLSVSPLRNPNSEIVDDGVLHPINQVPCSWTGEEFGMGNTTGGDYVKFKNVDFAVYGEKGPYACYIMASNYAGETTDKTWSVYLDSIDDMNKITTFTVRPINGWDYQQKIVKQLDTAITGIHDVYLVCNDGGSVWSLTFTDDEEITKVSYDLPFNTAFDSEDTVWLKNVIDMKGLSFSGALTATSCDTNYNSSAPVTDESKLVVNGSMVLRFDAPDGDTLKNAVLTYSGRSITSPATDSSCVLFGSVIFYLSTDGEVFNKIGEMKQTSGTFSVDIATMTDGLKTFYIKIEIIRTSAIASWTRLNSLSVTADMTSKDAKLVKITPEPQGATLPASFDFSDNSWKNYVYAKSAGMATQQAIDTLNKQISCLQPTTSRKYEGIVFAVASPEGKTFQNLCVRLSGRAVGGSSMAVYVGSDGENYDQLFVLSQTSVTDNNYDQITAGVKQFEKPVKKAYVKVVFYSTGDSFIDYASMINLDVTANEIDESDSNIPFNTVFSSSKTQINSWLRHVSEMRFLYVKKTASDTIMYSAVGKDGEIVLRFNSGEKTFENLYSTLKCKAVTGSSIIFSASNNGKDFEEIAIVNEQTDEYANSNSYAHNYDISRVAKGHKTVWLKFTLNALGSEGSCTLNSLLVSGTAPYVPPETLIDKWANYVFDTSMFDDGTFTLTADLDDDLPDDFDDDADGKSNKKTIKKKKLVKRKIANSKEQNENNVLWIIIVCASVLLIAAGTVFTVIFVKKKNKN